MPQIDGTDFADARVQALTAERDARRALRAHALSSLQERRAAFAESIEGVYSSEAILAEREGDLLEEMGALLLYAVDGLQPHFDRLDVAADSVAYLGPNGRRVCRSAWRRESLAAGFAEALQGQLSAEAFAVLLASVKLHAI